MTDAATTDAELDQMDKILGISFTNSGAFLCKAKLMYTLADGSTGMTDDWGTMNPGQMVFMNPGDKGLPAGAVIQLYIDIIAGNDRTGGVNFHYGPAHQQVAQYAITGTTFFSHVDYQGIVGGR